MNTLKFLLIFLLQFEVVSGQPESIHARAGDVVSLLCPLSSCSSVNWSVTWTTEIDGIRSTATEMRPRSMAAYLEGTEGPSLTDECSLYIGKVTEEDAGLYSCKQDDQLREIELSVMTVELLSSPLDSDLMRDQNMVLECSQFRFCSDGVLHWIGERGKTLCTSWEKCVSLLEVLPVSRVSNYTCQFVKGGTVMVEAQYTVVFTEVDAGGPDCTQPPPPPPDRKMLIINTIMIVVVLLILLVILVVVILVKRKSRRDAGQEPRAGSPSRFIPSTKERREEKWLLASRLTEASETAVHGVRKWSERMRLFPRNTVQGQGCRSSESGRAGFTPDVNLDPRAKFGLQCH